MSSNYGCSLLLWLLLKNQHIFVIIHINLQLYSNPPDVVKYALFCSTPNSENVRNCYWIFAKFCTEKGSDAACQLASVLGIGGHHVAIQITDPA